MNMSKKMIVKISILTVLVAGLLVSAAQAQIRFEASADETGISIFYDIIFVGANSFTLDSPGDSQSISISPFFINVADITVTLNEISTEPPGVTLGVAATSPLLPQPVEADVTIPFGEVGANVVLGAFFREPITGNNTFDASVLFTMFSTDYEVVADLPDIPVQGQWSGTADSANNIIQEQVVISEGVTLDLSFVVEPGLFTTNVSYEIDMNFDFPGGGQAIPDNATGFPPITGMLPVPNGSYHIWYKM